MYAAHLVSVCHMWPYCESSRLRNDLYCVEWDVKLYYTIPYLLRIQKSTGSESQSPSKSRKYLAKRSATETSVAVSLWCSLVCVYSVKYRYKTKDLKKGLAGRTSKSESKSKSRAFKSKSKSMSSKNGLKSGLESKSGLEYYKSGLNFHHWCKTPSSAFSKKKFQRRHPIFCTFSLEPLVQVEVFFVQLKTLAPSARYSTFKYPVTLKPGLGVSQGHRQLYH